jgi:hypothetical protein
MTLRRAQTATLSVMAGAFIVSSGVCGATIAEAHRYHLVSTTSTCANRPAAAARVVSDIATKPGASVASSASRNSGASSRASATPATTSSSPSATPKPSTSPTPSTSPAGSKSPSPSASPTPTPSKSPKPTPKPTPTPKPKPKPKTAQLCVFVQPFSSRSVRPGGTASYEIWVWSTVTEAQGVSVTAVVGSVAHVDAARFTVCPKPSGDVCTLGALPTGQSEVLVAASFVRKAASSGEQITLTATARASKARAFHSAATVGVIAAATPSSSASTDPSLPSSTLGSGSLPSLPNGALTSPNGDPSGLFPTVSPAGSSSPSGAARQTRKNLDPSNARDVSATLPLDTRLIGGQLAGLAVLAAAIAVAIARLSLRGPRPHDGADAAKKS